MSVKSKEITVFAEVNEVSHEVGVAKIDETDAGTTVMVNLLPEWGHLNNDLKTTMQNTWTKNFDPFTLHEIVIEVSP